METKKFKIVTPENFEKVSLPYFKEWLADLKTNPPQCRGKMETKDGHCCLARLSIVQGRFKNGTDGLGNAGILEDGNPCFRLLGYTGWFPQGCCVEGEGENRALTFAGLNDYLQFSMLEIAEVLEAFYKE